MTQSRHGFKQPGPVSLPVSYDERYTDRVFAEFKQQYGFGDGIRLGDMPARVISDIMRRAQELKIKEQGL